MKTLSHWVRLEVPNEYVEYGFTEKFLKIYYCDNTRNNECSTRCDLAQLFVLIRKVIVSIPFEVTINLREDYRNLMINENTWLSLSHVHGIK